MSTIGIDIGSTHVDAVLLSEKKEILATTKQKTSTNIEEDVLLAIEHVVKKAQKQKNEIQALFLGTTHALNALLQPDTLRQIGVLRIAENNPDLPSGFSWPEDLRKKVIVDTQTIQGGHDCTGKAMTCLQEDAVQKAACTLVSRGAEGIAIIATFSPLNGSHESLAKNIIHSLFPQLPVTLSMQVGPIGFIERENATIINAALIPVMEKMFLSLKKKIELMGIQAPISIVQNDATIMDYEEALYFPIKTVATGQANSLVGAAKLANIQDACIVDIGGTSTDVGIIASGLTRRSGIAKKIGGVQLQSTLPDTYSLPIGGGTIFIQEETMLQRTKKSCKHTLFQNGLSFGGNTCTLTDLGVVLDLINIPEAIKPKNIDKDMAYNALLLAKQEIDYAIRIMMGEKIVPIILVGGASDIFRPFFQDAIFLEHRAVANAYGAACAEISHEITEIVSLKNDEKALIETMKETAIQGLITMGLDRYSIRISSVSITPFAYTVENLAKVCVKASGKT